MVFIHADYQSLASLLLAFTVRIILASHEFEPRSSVLSIGKKRLEDMFIELESATLSHGMTGLVDPRCRKQGREMLVDSLSYGTECWKAEIGQID